MKKFEFKYKFEFFCSPIWIEENVKNPTPRNVEIADLVINRYLKEELEELNHLYQEIFNDNYPPESDFKDPISEYIFVNRVLISAELLAKEVGEQYTFVFDYLKWRGRKEQLSRKLVELYTKP